MKFLFELSKEHKTLPKTELLGVISLYSEKFEIIDEFNGFIFIKIEKPKINEIKKRLALTHRIDKLLFVCKNLKELFYRIKSMKINDSFSVRVKNYDKKLEGQLGNLIKGKVDLENPKNEIRVIFAKPNNVQKISKNEENLLENFYVSLKIADIDRKQYDERAFQNKPFFYPISLHPKFARTLVNLAKVKKGIVLDPFCGTGTILIEGGLLKLKVIGTDIQEKMIKGTEKNLNFYNIKNYKLYCCDVSEIGKYISKMDAIITDPPYGRSATTKKENIEQLYERAFAVFKDVLKKDKFLTIILPNENSINIGKKYFELVEVHELRVHKSLTRWFCVFRNS